MGTDIHMMVQRVIGREWVHVPWVSLDILEKAEDRDYVLFGLLADLRTHDHPAHFEPRGLPDDLVIPPAKMILPPGTWYEDALNEPYWLGDHSFSHLTVKELSDLFYAIGFKRTGPLTFYARVPEFRFWKSKLYPMVMPLHMRYEYVAGTKIKMVADWPGYKFGDTHEWDKEYDDNTIVSFDAEDIYEWRLARFHRVLDWLKTLGEPEKVRIVFGFDS